MIVIGITGSIGMGKSTASQMLMRLGVPVHDSDEAAHAALKSGSTVFDEIVKTFPKAYNKKQDRIDRKKLGEIVFGNPDKKGTLESIVHPFVQESQRQFIKQMRVKGMKIVALDIPLLFETGAQDRVDYTVTVIAPFHIQTQRVMARPNMTLDKFNAILESQMPDLQKQRLSDFVVQTGLGRSRSFSQLRAMLQDIKKLNAHAECAPA